MRLGSWDEVPEDLWREIAMGLPDVSDPKKGLWSAGQLLREVKSSPHLRIAMEDFQGRRLIASVLTLRNPDRGLFEIVYSYTDPRFRGRGLMRSLFLDFLSELEPGSKVWLEAASTNQEAQALYRKVGFMREGVRPGYYSDGTDSWLFRYDAPLR